MNFKYLAGILFIIALSCGTTNAQRRSAEPNSEDEELMSSKFFGYGLMTHTRGGIIGGAVLRSSSPVSLRNRKPVHRYLGLELVNLRHPQESMRGGLVGTRYSFGKVNYLLSVRPEYGREWYFFKKAGESSIGLSGILAAGPSIGVEKPYFIRYGSGLTGGEMPRSVVYDPDVHTDQGSILGAAGVWQGGLSNLGLVPGAHIKAALNIDMSTFGDNITGFELGTTAEFFTRRPEIINAKITETPQTFITAYLTLYFADKKLSNNDNKKKWWKK